MVAALAAATGRDIYRVSACTAALPILPVLPADEYQAKQLVPSSALTKFPLGGEVFGKELRARDKKKVAPLMHSRPPIPFPSS